MLIGGVGVGTLMTLMTLLFLPALYALSFRVAREPRPGDGIDAVGATAGAAP